MILLKVDIPKGEIPRLEPELLPSNAAQTAENCRFDSGAVVPLNGMTTIETPTKVGTKKTIYKFNDSYWCHWITDVDCIRVPIADDTDEVTCWTGDGVPKVTDTDIATAGGTDYPEDSYILGVPAPTSAPVATAVGNSLDPSLEEDRAYVVTFVCEVGVSTPAELEGPNSDVSNIVATLDSLPGALVLANELRTDIISHFANATRHVTGLQSTATMPAVATDLTTLIALVTVQLTLYAAHNADAILAGGWAYHNAQTADKALASAAAPVTLPGAITRLNDLKAKYNDHEDETVGHDGSASVTADQTASYDAGYVTLTIPAFPAGDYNFTAKRIYRTQNAGVAGSTEYLFVAELTGDLLTYTDSISNNDLGSEIKTTTWDAPPSDLHSLKLHPGGFLVGLSDMDLCVSVAYQPHAWPVAWQIKLDYPGVGIEIFGTSILVTTTGPPKLYTGLEPDSLTPERTELMQSCESKRGIVSAGDAVFFPSPDGLFVLGLGIAQNATEKLFKRSDWQALDPTTILGAFHDNRYYGFYDDGATQAGFIFDLENNDLSFIDTYATAVFVDPEDDTLYLQVGDDIISWNTDTSNPLTSTWKGRREVVQYPLNPGFAQVKASSYPVTFKLYAEIAGTMTLKHTESVSSSKPFPLPSGYMSDVFEAEIIGGFRSMVVAETLYDFRRA